jgi:hypothetical protein
VEDSDPDQAEKYFNIKDSGEEQVSSAEEVAEQPQASESAGERVGQPHLSSVDDLVSIIEM